MLNREATECVRENAKSANCQELPTKPARVVGASPCCRTSAARSSLTRHDRRNKAHQLFVAAMTKQFKQEPEKFGALGAAALQVWAHAANEVKSLDREKAATAIRGHDIPRHDR